MAFEPLKYVEKETTMTANILIIDELNEFIGDADPSSDRAKYKQAENVRNNIQSIAQLGRSAHIHMILATQTASPSLFPPSLRTNVGERIVCGKIEENGSRCIFDSDIGASVSTRPGSEVAYAKGDMQFLQGYFTPLKKVIEQGTIKPGYVFDGKKMEKKEDIPDASPIQPPIEDQSNNVSNNEEIIQDTKDPIVEQSVGNVQKQENNVTLNVDHSDPIKEKLKIGEVEVQETIEINKKPIIKINKPIVKVEKKTIKINKSNSNDRK